MQKVVDDINISQKCFTPSELNWIADWKEAEHNKFQKYEH